MKYHVRVVSANKYASKVYEVDFVEEGYKVLMSKFSEVAYKTGKKFYIFICDDRTTGYLYERYEELKDKFYFNHAGEAGRIIKYMDKHEILLLAEKHEVNVLKNVVVNRGEITEGLEYLIITKSIFPNVGGWKSDIHICYCKEKLREAYKKIDASQVVIQKYIDKKNLYFLDGLCGPERKETFLAMVHTAI
ncbi:MAG: hypothetical protein HUK10_13640 [Bacteroides heparinolyticus]|nr:hypothetical protein [Bacteroides heparinolyticus]